jgi:hypothetical protein
MILVIPRNDGLKISVEGNLHHKDMTPEEMINMGIRFQQVALEMIRLEQLKDASDQQDVVSD